MTRALTYAVLFWLATPSVGAADYAAGEIAFLAEDYAHAMREWTAIATPTDDNSGDPDAQANLGFMYHTGLGVDPNPVTAAIWYRRAAEQGNRFAATELGILYATGRGVPEDLAEAQRWYIAAGDQRSITTRTQLTSTYRVAQPTAAPALLAVTAAASDRIAYPAPDPVLKRAPEPTPTSAPLPLLALPGADTVQVAQAVDSDSATDVPNVFSASESSLPASAGSKPVADIPTVARTEVMAEPIANGDLGSVPASGVQLAGAIQLSALPARQSYDRVQNAASGDDSLQPQAAASTVKQDEPRTVPNPPSLIIDPAAISAPEVRAVPNDQRNFIISALPADADISLPPVIGPRPIVRPELQLQSSPPAPVTTAQPENASRRPEPLSTLELLTRLADSGDPRAQIRLAYLHDDPDGSAYDPAHSTVLFDAAARQDDPEAQFQLADRLDRGHGVARDPAAAANWYAAAHAQGYFGPVPEGATRPVDAEALNVALQAYVAGDFPTSLDAWRDLADRGHAAAQFNLAVQLSEGQGTAANDYHALRWFAAAAAQGHRQAQYRMARTFDDGSLIPRDASAAAAWYRKAADQGHAMAQFQLGLMHVEGDGVPLDLGAARELFEAAAEQGVSVAKHNLATILDIGVGVPRNRTAAAILYEEAAEQGIAPSEYRLAVMREFAEGVPQDRAAAIELYQRAAKKGLANAQYSLATILENGDGLPVDLAAARDWYTRAAAQDHPRALTALGRFYAGGIAGTKDGYAAVGWYRRAAAQGDAEAQYALARAFEAGEFVAQDESEASTWLNRAAQQGYAPAQAHLGEKYAAGDGVAEDMVQALKWLSIAANSGDREIIARARAVSSRSTPLQQQQAKVMIDNWQPANLAPLPDSSELLQVRRGS